MAKTENYYGTKLDLLNASYDKNGKIDLQGMSPEELAQLRAAAEQRRIQRSRSNTRPNQRAAGMDTKTPPPASGSLRDYSNAASTGMSPEAQRYARTQQIKGGLRTGAKVAGAVGGAGLAAAGLAALPGDLEDKAMVAGGGAAAAGAWQGYRNRDNIKATYDEWRNARGERKASLQRELDAYNNGNYEAAQAERNARMGTTEPGSKGPVPAELRDKPKPQTYDMNAQQRAEMERAQGLHDEAKQRYDRLNRQYKQAGNVKNPDVKYMEGLKTQLNAAQADMDAAISLRDEVRAQPRAKSTFDEIKANPKSAGKAAGQVASEAAAAATSGAEGVAAKIKDEAPKIAEKVKAGTASTGEKVQNVVNRAWSKTKDVAGRVRPGGSAKADAAIETETAKNMPEGMDADTKNKFAKKFRITAGRMMYVPALYDMGRSFADRADEIGVKPAAKEFLDANIDMLKETYNEVSQIEDVGDFFSFVGDTAIGLVGGFLSATSNGLKYAANDLQDMFGGEGGRFNVDDAWDWTRTAPEAAQRTGVMTAGGGAPVGYSAAPQAPRGFQGVQPLPMERSPYATPNETPAPAPTMAIGAGDQSLGANRVTQEQFAFGNPGSQRVDIRGLRGSGYGNIDATNAPGGAEGFLRRVEESRKAGAYEPVSEARKQQGLRDLENVRRGTDAIRELSASRLGVPVQYLDAVRSGSLSRREAALLGARDNGIAADNAPGMYAAQQRAAAGLRGEARQARMDSTAAFDRVAENYGNLTTPDAPIRGAERLRNFAINFAPNADFSQIPPQQMQSLGLELELRDALSRNSSSFLKFWEEDASPELMTPAGVSVIDYINQKTEGEKKAQWFWEKDNLKVTIPDDNGEPRTITLDVNDDMKGDLRNYITARLGVGQPSGLR